ncbi:transglutaminase family protein [Sulfitobacter sp. LCG007]
MLYNVRLSIDYDYHSPAAGGRHVLRAVPMDDGHGQKVIASLLEISPAPAERLDREDFFGNKVTDFALRDPHDHIRITMTSRVERIRAAVMPQDPVRLSELPACLAACRDVGRDSPLHFTTSSFRIPLNAAMTQFARKVVTPDQSSAEAVIALGHALHERMLYDADATTVDTPVAEAFSRRHGVCQDFSHIMIACLRGIGIPAAYVSGYLRTLPPPGQPRLEGADAMHAWVRAWCGPQAGWLEFDPTNDVIGGLDHIAVGYGRDYSDVAPIRGSMRMSGEQESNQSVDVVPAG